MQRVLLSAHPQTCCAVFIFLTSVAAVIFISGGFPVFVLSVNRFESSAQLIEVAAAAMPCKHDPIVWCTEENAFAYARSCCACVCSRSNSMRCMSLKTFLRSCVYLWEDSAVRTWLCTNCRIWAKGYQGFSTSGHGNAKRGDHVHGHGCTGSSICPVWSGRVA